MIRLTNIKSTENIKKIKEGFIGQKMIVLPPNVKKLALRNDLTKRFHLTNIGYYPHAAWHDRERRSGSSQYILLYCIEGRGNIIIHGENIELKPHSFFIIPKNVAHHYTSSQDDPWSIYWVHFIGEFADKIYDRYMEKNPGNQFIPYDEHRIRAFEMIFNMLENSFETRDLEIINIKLLDYISSFIYYKEIDPSYGDDDMVHHSITFMKANINHILTVNDFARQQNLSLSHYSRVFRTKTGGGPSNYFNQLKVQKSCQLLYFTDKNIKEICAELGFNDPYYFSRLFKKIMGISPAQYKNQHKRI